METKKYKILFIDDDRFLLDMYEKKFQKEDFDVFTRADASDINSNFLDDVSKIKPDLISIDDVMPERHGFDAIKLLKSDGRTEDIPIFMLAYCGQGTVAKAKNLGVTGCISKVETIPSELVKIYSDFLKR